MSLFYPFWQQPRGGPLEDGKESGEYPTANRLVLPQSGDPLLIEFHPTGGRGAPLLYRGRLRAGGLRRLIAESIRPIADDGPPAQEIVRPQAGVTVSFVQDDVLYRFETVVAGVSELAGELISLSLPRPRTVTRIQRRRFYRVQIETATSFYALTGEHATELAAGQILNLSAGGLLLATNREVPASTRVVVRVPVGRDGSPVDIQAEALECVPAPGKMTGYNIRFRFDNGKDFGISEEEQEGINQYLFEQQRMMLRVRKLMRGKA